MVLLMVSMVRKKINDEKRKLEVMVKFWKKSTIRTKFLSGKV
jgi:hypothetical protein